MPQLLAFAVLCSTSVAQASLRGSYPMHAEMLLSAPAVTVAHGLFEQTHDEPVGSSRSEFLCNKAGSGTTTVASGPGGCLNAQIGIAGFNGALGLAGPEVAKNQTVQSFLVQPCGIVAPHSHANAAEINTVIKGEGIIAQLTTNSNELQISHVQEGDSFFFAQGSYHWWINLGTEQLLTVGVFVDTPKPDAALMGYDQGAGLVGALMGTLMGDYSILNTLIGQSSGKQIIVPFGGGDSPLFPMLNPQSCEEARSSLDSSAFMSGRETFQMNPPGTNLFKRSELESASYDITSDSTPVNGPGGGLRPLAGSVSAGMPFVTGTADTKYNGGLAPGATPSAAYWPGLTNVGGGVSLVKFVVGYCGMVAIHTHVNAAEWNTVLSGQGQVSYYQVNTGDTPQLITMNVKKGDTFVFPQGSAHWWVNDSPQSQLVTVGGFTAPFPDTSLLEAFLSQTSALFPKVTDAVLGEGYVPASKLQRGDGAGGLFPLLSTRSPSTCGGDTPCDSC